MADITNPGLVVSRRYSSKPADPAFVKSEKVSQQSHGSRSQASSLTKPQVKISNLIHDLFGEERDKMNRLRSDPNYPTMMKNRSYNLDKKKAARKALNSLEHKNDPWTKRFELNHSSMVINMAVIDLFKEKSRELRLSMAAKKPNKWDFSHGKVGRVVFDESSANKPDLLGAYNLKFDIIDRSCPSFIYRKEKKNKKKTQASPEEEPIQLPKIYQKKQTSGLGVPNFGKMKSRRSLVEAKDHRLIDMDELEDQRITREIQNDPNMQWMPKDSS